MRTSNPSGYVPFVWSTGSDDFDYNELAGDWDAVDAQITRVSGYEPPLGSLWPIYLMSSSYLPYTPPTGWAYCNGQTLSSAQHSFPAPLSGTSVTLPDLRNKSLLGANTSFAFGTAGTIGNAATNAPGPSGAQGSNSYNFLPPHFHLHQHIHSVGDTGPGATPVETQTVPTGQNMLLPSVSQSGGPYTVARDNHAHALDAIYSTNPRRPTNATSLVNNAPNPDDSSITRYMTSKEIWATTSHAVRSGTNTQNTTYDTEPVLLGTGPEGAETNPATGLAYANFDQLWLDTRNQSVGVIWLMYVLQQSAV